MFIFKNINAQLTRRRRDFPQVNSPAPRSFADKVRDRRLFVSLLQLWGKFEGFTASRFIENTLGCIEFFTRCEGNFYASADETADGGETRGRRRKTKIQIVRCGRALGARLPWILILSRNEIARPTRLFSKLDKHRRRFYFQHAVAEASPEQPLICTKLPLKTRITKGSSRV